MQIGLIGGIGPAAQDYYCRQLISLFAQAERSLDMTIVHADTPTLLANLAADRRIEQAEIFANLADRLDRAGADLIGVTSIAGHFCRHEFAARSPLPVVDMIDAVAHDVAEHRFEKIGILGTRTVMESRFYSGLASVDVISPPGSALDDVHAAYVEMAKTGRATTAQRAIFHDAATHMIHASGAQAIMLGGTDLALAFDAETCPFPLVDCAAIHARAIFKKAIG
ncbi:MAG: aspartate/glutamate racemase family protein [Sphingomonas sp.]|uniref:aspartate/glutamate racemase family protein n=1 Tax=Sphingomonas sp. TaxID=28214 RepID=UPI0035A93909|nr:aspartate/glutamate racemase family protein [Sphingomonas sp.]